MKAIKFLIAIILVSSFNLPAYAGRTSETATGGVVGGLLGAGTCRNCNPRTRNQVAAAGALAGALFGYSSGDRNETRNDQVQQHLDNERTYVNRDVNPIIVASPHPTMQQEEVVVQRVGPLPAYRQTRYVQPAPAPVSNGDCDEQYFRGNYNPQAARAYCEGRRERERQVREAYEAGLSGN